MCYNNGTFRGGVLMSYEYFSYMKKAIDLGSALFDYYKGRILTPSQIEIIAGASAEEKINALQKTAEYRLTRNRDTKYLTFCQNIQMIFGVPRNNGTDYDYCSDEIKKELGHALLEYYKGRELSQRDIELISGSSSNEEKVSAMDFYSEDNLSNQQDGSYMRFCQNKQDIFEVSKEIANKKSLIKKLPSLD